MKQVLTRLAFVAGGGRGLDHRVHGHLQHEDRAGEDEEADRYQGESCQILQRFVPWTSAAEGRYVNVEKQDLFCLGFKTVVHNCSFQ